MVEASVVVSIVIAVVSFLGTLIVAYLNNATTVKVEKHREKTEINRREMDQKLTNERHIMDQKLDENRHVLDRKLEEFREKRQDERNLAALTAKYSQPLMVAAYELQARLYELIEYPISKEHLEMDEGLDDIKIFTCYRFAVFLAWTHILKSKTQYFSFTTDKNLRSIGDLILRLDEEFDRHRGNDGQNVGVWPGYRILVSERMIKSASHEKEVPLDTIVKGYSDFRQSWEADFRRPMGYFCQWIDDMLLDRKTQQAHHDDALRCTQHNMFDMVQLLDSDVEDLKLYPHMRLVEEPCWCDCVTCLVRHPDRAKERLKYRSDSRRDDKGLRPWYFKSKADRKYDASVTLEATQAMTCTDGFNQALTGSKRKREFL